MANHEQNPELAHFTVDDLIDEIAARVEAVLIVYETGHKTNGELVRSEQRLCNCTPIHGLGMAKYAELTIRSDLFTPGFEEDNNDEE